MKLIFGKKFAFNKVLVLLFLLIITLLFFFSNLNLKTSKADAQEIDLSQSAATENYNCTDTNGYIFTGDAGSNKIKITIGANVNITLRDVTINNLYNDNSTDFNSIIYSASTSQANNIILEGTNFLSGGRIIIGKETKLTIKGDGNLKLMSVGTGISFPNEACENAEINIENTTIEVNSKDHAEIANGNWSASAKGSCIGLLPSSTVKPGKIKIVSSTCTLISHDGAGLGGGYNNPEKITIEVSFSTIYAITDINTSYASAIGGGNGRKPDGTRNGADAKITFTDCPLISASGLSSYSAGIGGGVASYAEIEIKGDNCADDKIYAESSSHGAGIGGGGFIITTTLALITINGIKTIEAIAKNGAGIGGGANGYAANIKITDCDYINSTSSQGGAGIGGGFGDTSVNSGMNSAPAIVSITNAKEIYASANYGACIGGGDRSGDPTEETTVIIDTADKIICKSLDFGKPFVDGSPEKTNYGAGIGGGNANSPAYVSITSVKEISSQSIYGAGIGAGRLDDLNSYDSSALQLDKMTVIEIFGSDNIYAESEFAGAGIGGGFLYSSPEIYINSKKVTAVGGNAVGAGIGGGYDNSNSEVVISSTELKVKSFSRGIGAGVGGGIIASDHNVVFLLENTDPSSLSITDYGSDSICICDDVEVTAVGGINSPGIGAGEDLLNSGTTQILIGNPIAPDKPSVTAVSGIFSVEDLYDYDPQNPTAYESINNMSAIGAGCLKPTTDILKVVIKLNSGNIKAIDRAYKESQTSSPYTSSIGVPINNIDPGSISIINANIHLFGNATFFCDAGVDLPSSAKLFIGGDPPEVLNWTGKAISYPTNFKTTIRNFDNGKGLDVGNGSFIDINTKTAIVLETELATSVIASRGTTEKIDVPHMSIIDDPTIENVKSTTAKITADLYINYYNSYTPNFNLKVGVTETDLANVTNLTPIAMRYGSATISGLTEKTAYRLVFLVESPYYKGDEFIGPNYNPPSGFTTKASKYTVHFTSNTGGTDTIKNQNFPEDTSAQLNKNSFTKKGYSFVKWNIERDGNGGTSFSDKESVSYDSLGADITVYAIWRPNTYKFVYVKNSSSSGKKITSSTSIIYDENFTVPVFPWTSVEGKTFNGLNLKSDGTGTTYNEGESFTWNFDHNLTVYGIWKPHKYKIFFLSNNKENLTKTQSVTYDTPITLKKNTFSPSKKTQIFSHWIDENTGKEYNDGKKFTYKIVGNLTLKAVYKTASDNNEKINTSGENKKNSADKMNAKLKNEKGEVYNTGESFANEILYNTFVCLILVVIIFFVNFLFVRKTKYKSNLKSKKF